MGTYSYRFKCASCGGYETNPFRSHYGDTFCNHCGSFCQKKVEVGSWIQIEDERSWWHKLKDGFFYIPDQEWVPKEKGEQT